MDVKNTDFEKTKHNLCFLILEGVIMLPLLVMNFSWIHALAYLVLGGYLVNQLMFKEAYKGNPGALFSTMVLVDILLIGVLHMDYVWMQKGDFEQSLTLFMDSIVSSVSILAIAGILLAVFYKSKILKIFKRFIIAYHHNGFYSQYIHRFSNTLSDSSRSFKSSVPVLEFF